MRLKTRGIQFKWHGILRFGMPKSIERTDSPMCAGEKGSKLEGTENKGFCDCSKLGGEIVEEQGGYVLLTSKTRLDEGFLAWRKAELKYQQYVVTKAVTLWYGLQRQLLALFFAPREGYQEGPHQCWMTSTTARESTRWLLSVWVITGSPFLSSVMLSQLHSFFFYHWHWYKMHTNMSILFLTISQLPES